MSGSVWDKLQPVYDIYAKLEIGFAAIFNPIWDIARRIWEFVGPTRFSAFTVLAGGVLLVGTDQGRELAARVGEDGSTSYLYLYLAVEWLAIQSWYWARIVLPVVDENLVAGDDVNTKTNLWKTWVPRSYAILTFIVAVTALAFAGHGWSVVFMAAFGVATLWLLMVRRKVARKFQGVSPRFKELTTARGKLGENLDLDQLAPFSKAMLLFSVIAAFVALVLASIYTVSVGQLFGATAIAFFGFGCLIPMGSFLIMRSKAAGFPVITTFFLIAFLSSLFNDNHVVQTIDASTEAANKQLSMEDAVARWLDANPLTGDKEVPLVLISTAGGGLRAAYWTATVLGALQDRCPQFVRRTFAISGVSGGSVGASIFAAHTADENSEATDLCNETDNSASHSAFMKKVLDGDFLGPTVAAMLFPDLLQRIIPYPFLPSRGVVLANSWVEEWKQNCAINPSSCRPDRKYSLEGPFLGFGPGEDDNRWHPALLLNGTHQETGKRIITSHIMVKSDVFFDAYDMHHVLQNDVSLATAALNSARFTYVSPPGTLISADGTNFGHVLDGGYFENYGAVTSAELLLKLVEEIADQGRVVRPIIIQITSDPGLEMADYAQASNVSNFLDIEPNPARFINELAGPIRGILATRSARGVLAGKTLAEVLQLIEEKGDWFPSVTEPVFAHFEMCIDPDNPEENPPPLGWTMSKQSRDLIASMHNRNIDGCNNKAEFEKVIAALGTEN